MKGGAGPAPETIELAGGDVTVGFAQGVQRQPATLAAFKVTKHPITVHEYKSCVDAAACTPPAATCGGGGGLLDRSTFTSDGASDVPVTCVPPEGIAAYCKWTGGRLVRATEWLLAARGASVQRYPWGQAATTCARHPVVAGILADATSCCAGVDGCTMNVLATVGRHPAGASAAGLEDVLFASGEVVLPDPRTSLTSCGGEGATCAVVGRAGGIDGLVAFRDPKSISTTFRCAYEGTGP